MGPDEYTRAMGHDRLREREGREGTWAREGREGREGTFTKKKGLWSGIKNIFHQRQRTPSRSRGERRGESSLSSLSYSCLGQARQEEEEEEYGGFGEGRGARSRERLSRNLSMSHESVFQMEPLPSQTSPPEERLSPSPRTTSSSALPPLPPMMHSELQAVLRMRESRSRNLSKHSADFTDDEDLGLPKSLQNSPGDFSDGLEVAPRGPAWMSSRHHSSCSDNSLLSLDSYSEARGEEDFSPLHRNTAQGDGRLNHMAARHKMAVRPRRNHAVRPPRRLQQLEEVVEPEVQPQTRVECSLVPGLGETREDSRALFEDQRTKSKSLDMSFRGLPPSTATLARLAEEGEKNTKVKVEEKDGFLSRLFGSKRQKMRGSTSKREAPIEPPTHSPLQPLVPRSGVAESSRLSYYQPTSTSPSPPPSRQKTKPPAPPPPESPPPQGVPVKKSQSFRGSPSPAPHREGSSPPLGFPSLPAQPLRPEVILKKNKSMSSALSVEASHQRFRSSIENWSFANEGLKKSIGSLAEHSNPTTQSNESLKTISSLLEEPDMLEQTAVPEREETEYMRGVFGSEKSVEPLEETPVQSTDIDTTEQVDNEVNEEMCNEDANDLKGEGLETQVPPSLVPRSEGWGPKYQDEEAAKLLQLADLSLDNEPNKEDTFTSKIMENSVELQESDLDLSINSLEVFHIGSTQQDKTEQEPYDEKSPELLDSPQAEGSSSIPNLFKNLNPPKCLEMARDPENISFDHNSPRQQEENSLVSQGVSFPTVHMDKSQIFHEGTNSPDKTVEKNFQLHLEIPKLPAWKVALGNNTTQQSKISPPEIRAIQSPPRHQSENTKPCTEAIVQPTVHPAESEIVRKESVGEGLTPRSDRTRRNGVAAEAPALDGTKATPSQEVEAPLQEGEGRKPEVSPKPVPAPRHFFLRKPSVTKPPGDVPEEPVSELSNVWARRSRSAATLPIKEKEVEKETAAVDKEEEKENEPSKEVLINVKERAKSFSGIQNLAFVSPQPFRPTSIAHEIRMTKPVNIPPKPKLAAKPVPAPRQFRSVSTSELVTSGTRTLPSTKSANSVAVRDQPRDPQVTPAAKVVAKVGQNTTSAVVPLVASECPVKVVPPTYSEVLDRAPPPTTEDMPERVAANVLTRSAANAEIPARITTTAEVQARITKSSEVQARVSSNEEFPARLAKAGEIPARVPTAGEVPYRLATPADILPAPKDVGDTKTVPGTTKDNLEEIQVRQMLSQFQKTPSPEKPVRRHLTTAKEKADSEEASRNVMAMARRFNAMATP